MSPHYASSDGEPSEESEKSVDPRQAIPEGDASAAGRQPGRDGGTFELRRGQADVPSDLGHTLRQRTDATAIAGAYQVI